MFYLFIFLFFHFFFFSFFLLIHQFCSYLLYTKLWPSPFPFNYLTLVLYISFASTDFVSPFFQVFFVNFFFCGCVCGVFNTYIFPCIFFFFPPLLPFSYFFSISFCSLFSILIHFFLVVTFIGISVSSLHLCVFFPLLVVSYRIVVCAVQST